MPGLLQPNCVPRSPGTAGTQTPQRWCSAGSSSALLGSSEGQDPSQQPLTEPGRAPQPTPSRVTLLCPAVSSGTWTQSQPGWVPGPVTSAPVRTGSYKTLQVALEDYPELTKRSAFYHSAASMTARGREQPGRREASAHQPAPTGAPQPLHPTCSHEGSVPSQRSTRSWWGQTREPRSKSIMPQSAPREVTVMMRGP